MGSEIYLKWPGMIPYYLPEKEFLTIYKNEGHDAAMKAIEKHAELPIDWRGYIKEPIIGMGQNFFRSRLEVKTEPEAERLELRYNQEYPKDLPSNHLLKEAWHAFYFETYRQVYIPSRILRERLPQTVMLDRLLRRSICIYNNRANGRTETNELEYYERHSEVFTRFVELAEELDQKGVHYTIEVRT